MAAVTLFEMACERFKMEGGSLKPNRFHLNVKDARVLLWQGLQYFTGLEKPVWLPEYEKVAEYLTDNKGKGLLLYGACGTGKTLITKKIIPAIISEYYDRLSTMYNAGDMHVQLENIKKKYFAVIDDLGTENATYQQYGNTICPFAEIVDNAEKEGRFLMVSTNLNLADENGFVKRYGKRTYDRLKTVFCCIAFNGASLRGY